MVNTKLTSCFTNIHMFYEKMNFKKNLQDRHKLCIFNITLFAYDFLFEQYRSLHDECLMNRSTSNQGAWHDYCPSSGAVQSRFGESLKRPTSLGQISTWVTWGIPTTNLARSDIFWWHDRTLLTGATPLLSENGHSRKNTTHNQRPARLICLGKN